MNKSAKVKVGGREGVLVGIWQGRGYVLHYLSDRPTEPTTGNSIGVTPAALVDRRPGHMQSYPLTDITVLDPTNQFA